MSYLTFFLNSSDYHSGNNHLPRCQSYHIECECPLFATLTLSEPVFVYVNGLQAYQFKPLPLFHFCIQRQLFTVWADKTLCDFFFLQWFKISLCSFVNFSHLTLGKWTNIKCSTLICFRSRSSKSSLWFLFWRSKMLLAMFCPSPRLWSPGWRPGSLTSKFSLRRLMMKEVG